MKAVLLKKLGGIENFELGALDDPELTEKSVKVRIRATAFNPIDYQMRRGGTESKLLKSSVLGREMAGVVTEVDPSVENFRVGDEVFAYVSNLGSNGTYAEEIVVPAALVARKPSNLSFAQAAAIPLVGLTAWQTVERCRINPEDSVFVAGGAGGVGSMIVRLLKLGGVERIVTTAGNEESRKQLLSIGLRDERILDYRDARLVDNLLQAAGSSFDFCLDTVGGAMSVASAETIRVNGVYADITFLATDAARELLFDKAATVINVSNYAYGLDGNAQRLSYYGNGLNRLRQLIEARELPATPIETIGDLSVETVQKAHQMLEDNRTRGKKLVMEIN